MRSDLFQHEVTKTSALFGRKSDVRVVFHGNMAATDGKTIYLPQLKAGVEVDDEAQAIMRGYVDHESGHVRHSDMPQVTETFKRWFAEGRKLAKALANGLEDVWLERRVIAEYPGAERNLRATTVAVNRRTIAAWASDPDAASKRLRATYITPVAITWEGRLPYGGEENEAMLEMIPPHIRERLPRYVERCLECQNSLEIIALAEEIEKELIDEAKELVEAEKKRREEAEKEKGEDESEPEEGMEGEAEEGEGEPGSSKVGKDDWDSELYDELKDEKEEEGASEPEDEATGGSEAKEDDEVEAEATADGDDEAGDAEGEGDDPGDGVEGEGEDEAKAEDEGDDGEASGAGELEDDEPDGEEGGRGRGEEDDEEDPLDELLDGDEAEEDEGDEGDEARGGGREYPEGEGHKGEEPDLDTFDDFEVEDAVKEALEERRLSGSTTYGEYRAWSTMRDRFVMPNVHGDQWERHLAAGTTAEYEHVLTGMIGPINVLRRGLERALAAKQTRDWDFGRVQGRLDARRFPAAMAGRENVFKERIERSEVDTAVEIVLDLSGSMQGAKIDLTRQCAIALAEAIDRTGVRYEMIGFNQPDPDRERPAGVPYTETLARWEPIYIWVFKAFEQRLFEAKPTMARISKCAGGNNCDGESLMMAYHRLSKRPEKRKVMMVLSDGSPACQSDSPAVVNRHTRGVIQFIQRQGVQVVGLGILDESVRSFYDDHVVLHDVNQLGTTAIGILGRMLLGDRRGADRSGLIEGMRV